jgi:hypothetical protein
MTTAYANYMARYETKHFCGFYLKLSTDFKTNYIYDFIWFSYLVLSFEIVIYSSGAYMMFQLSIVI